MPGLDRVLQGDYWNAPRTGCRTLAGGDNPGTRHPIPSFMSPGGANPPFHQGGRGSGWALTGGLRRPAILRRPCRDCFLSYGTVTTTLPNTSRSRSAL
jgi:hypothetical protein